MMVDSVEDCTNEFVRRCRVRDFGERGVEQVEAEAELVAHLKRERTAALRQLADSIKRGLANQRTTSGQDIESVREELVQGINSRLALLKEDFDESESAMGGQVGSLHTQIRSWKQRADVAEEGLPLADYEAKFARVARVGRAEQQAFRTTQQAETG